MTRPPDPVNPLTGMRGTGHRQAVTGDQARRRAIRADADAARAKKNHEHMWVAVLMFRTDPTKPDAIFDSETLMGPPVAMCFICEQDWTPDLHTTPCPGDPADEPGGPW